ncbi:MAG: hypothetical protein ACI8WB_003921 [Phenylobacterium sp.]|jgi:hypothetical protein
MDNKAKNGQTTHASRWPLIKQAMIFQLKLGLDALRDLLLSPVSIVAVIIDVLLRHDRKDSLFLRLMKYGRLSDHWINLFDTKELHDKHTNKSVDYWLGQVEQAVKTQKNGGEINQSHKEKLEQLLTSINSNSSNSSNNKSNKQDDKAGQSKDEHW